MEWKKNFLAKSFANVRRAKFHSLFNDDGDDDGDDDDDERNTKKLIEGSKKIDNIYMTVEYPQLSHEKLRCELSCKSEILTKSSGPLQARFPS